MANTKMKDDKTLSSKSRRGALKGASASAFLVVAAESLPKEWKKPVVNSIALPSHAVTTDSGGEGGSATTVPPTTLAATTTVPVTTSSTSTGPG